MYHGGPAEMQRSFPSRVGDSCSAEPTRESAVRDDATNVCQRTKYPSPRRKGQKEEKDKSGR
jgi:hypothetical protein